MLISNETDGRNGGDASTESFSPAYPKAVGSNQRQTGAVAGRIYSLGHDPVVKLSWHSVYEQVGRRKLGHDPCRHGRFTIIAEQR